MAEGGTQGSPVEDRRLRSERGLATWFWVWGCGRSGGIDSVLPSP